MQKALPVDSVRPFIEGVVKANGKLVAAERSAGESSPTRGSYRVDAERGQWWLELSLDPDGRIAGLKLTNPPAPDPPVEKSTIALRLPFRDPFTVVWGGDRIELNQHIHHKSQRRAADLLIIGDDGRTHSGDGKQSSDYHAWGKPVLAVADGKVITVVDGVPDSEPGRLNGYAAVGNMVVIEHAPKLYSMVAHLQPGKLRVRVGQRVRAGAVLGLVGNSGNSSEPHLHFQLQDAPAVEASYGIEAVFERVRVWRDGAETERTAYTFLKGDLISPH
jgi:murein DD-endopeptidase MepM/ murein hydrolase activator NlpD